MLNLIYYNGKSKKSFTLDLRRFLSALLTAIFIISLFFFFCELCIHAEKYSTTYKKALYNDIKSGDPAAIQHYEKLYTSRGIFLFGEDAEAGTVKNGEY